MKVKESPFACDMTAIAPEQRAAHLATIEKLFRSVADYLELANGYGFRLANDSEVLHLLTQFIALERLCCPFFGFAVEVESEGGSIWLKLTGREGIKPFILAEVGAHLPVQLNRKDGRQQLS